MRQAAIVVLILATQAFSQCGKERWPIKTMADKEIGEISPLVVDTTIEELRKWTAPEDLHHFPDHRHRPVEFSRYRIHALLISYKREADSDIHLVLASPENFRHTMVAEIPSGACVPVGWAVQDSALQGWIEHNVGHAPKGGKLKLVLPALHVVVEGIGFFDFIHGQTGVAPNGIELHPVTSIKVEDRGTWHPSGGVNSSDSDDSEEDVGLRKSNLLEPWASLAGQ